jgi:hypothetical protein
VATLVVPKNNISAVEVENPAARQTPIPDERMSFKFLVLK